jgi:hypothetical protein
MSFPFQRPVLPTILVLSVAANGLADSSISINETPRESDRIKGPYGTTGFPVVEGWHRDSTSVLGIFVVDRFNVSGGISMLARDSGGVNMAFARTLDIGDLLLVDDPSLWHNTTPISKIDPMKPAHRDVVILTWPSCREPSPLARAGTPSPARDA